MEFNDIFIGQDIVIFNSLAFEFPFAPDFSVLELTGEILMQHQRGISDSASRRENNRVSILRFMPDSFCKNPDYIKGNKDSLSELIKRLIIINRYWHNHKTGELLF